MSGTVRLLTEAELDGLPYVDPADGERCIRPASVAQLVALARWAANVRRVLLQVQIDLHPQGQWCRGDDTCGAIAALLAEIEAPTDD
jgi:hypothetical protein